MPHCKHLRKERDREPYQGNLYRCASLPEDPQPRISRMCDKCGSFQLRKRKLKITTVKKKSWQRDTDQLVKL